MIRRLLQCLMARPADIHSGCAGEVDSLAALSAGLGEWLPEFEPGCRPKH